MDKAMGSTRASELPQEAWERWELEHAGVLERATRAQRVLLEAAVRFVAVIAAQPILLRLAAFFLLHAGMECWARCWGARTRRVVSRGRCSSAPRWASNVSFISRPSMRAPVSLRDSTSPTHPRTLRRWLLVRDADLIVTASPRIVVLDFDRRRPWLRPLLQQFNKAEVALPWLQGRHVVMGFAAKSQRLSDAQPVLPKRAEAGYGFAEGCGGVWC